jgi:NAD(P)-dependent dehydrogenase (short-subunit alcohol dehydrogenase family)
MVLERHRVDVTLHPVDLRNGDELTRLAAACSNVDILVNNAGDVPGGSIETLDEISWRHAWELKVFGYINLTRALFAAMKARKAGAIIIVMGMSAENPSFEYVCGATANAGLAAFTKGLGRGSTRFGVRVMGVHPPATRTDRILKVMKEVAKLRYGDETRTDDLIRDGFYPEPIDPEQVAEAIVFLASERARQLSGIVLNLGA